VAGEDPFVISEYIYEYARGLQQGADSRFTQLVSTAKHFSAYDVENATDADGVYYIRQNFGSGDEQGRWRRTKVRAPCPCSPTFESAIMG
jgi:hypothetical protein